VRQVAVPADDLTGEAPETADLAPDPAFQCWSAQSAQVLGLQIVNPNVGGPKEGLRPMIGR
jgi:hypothetical protein